MEKIRIECLTEILEEIGVKATEEQVKRISEDFALHLEMENESRSYAHTSTDAACSNCEKIKKELKVEKDNCGKYIDFIKKDKKASYVGIANGVVHGEY